MRPAVVVASTRADFAAALAPVVASADNRQINSDYRTQLDDINKGASLQLDQQLGDALLTSISAWRQWDNTQFQDGDRTAQRSAAFPSSHDRGDLGYTQYSQELRLQTRATARWKRWPGCITCMRATTKPIAAR